MKKIMMLVMFTFSITILGQSKQELIDHYKSFYKEMKMRADLQGVINGLTHLDLLEPSQAKKDTLAYLYLSAGQHTQALNVIGVEKNDTDSDMAVEVKALSLKAIGQPKMAIPQYEVIFSRNPNASIAYELADLKTQVNDMAGAKSHIEYGLANVTDDQKRAFYEMQQPYQVSLKAAFIYLKALISFNEDQTNNLDAAIALLDEALAIDSNFNMAKISKDALQSKKSE